MARVAIAITIIIIRKIIIILVTRRPMVHRRKVILRAIERGTSQAPAPEVKSVGSPMTPRPQTVASPMQPISHQSGEIQSVKAVVSPVLVPTLASPTRPEASPQTVLWLRPSIVQVVRRRRH
jgi:hypothetical protein